MPPGPKQTKNEKNLERKERKRGVNRRGKKLTFTFTEIKVFGCVMGKHETMNQILLTLPSLFSLLHFFSSYTLFLFYYKRLSYKRYLGLKDQYGYRFFNGALLQFKSYNCIVLI